MLFDGMDFYSSWTLVGSFLLPRDPTGRDISHLVIHHVLVIIPHMFSVCSGDGGGGWWGSSTNYHGRYSSPLEYSLGISYPYRPVNPTIDIRVTTGMTISLFSMPPPFAPPPPDDLSAR